MRVAPSHILKEGSLALDMPSAARNRWEQGRKDNCEESLSCSALDTSRHFHARIPSILACYRPRYLPGAQRPTYVVTSSVQDCIRSNAISLGHTLTGRPRPLLFAITPQCRIIASNMVTSSFQYSLPASYGLRTYLRPPCSLVCSCPRQP